MFIHDLFIVSSTLPANDQNRYSPISNQSFISKVLEKTNISSHLNVHLNCDHLSNVIQSAYKQFHPTETVLLKVHNDISLNVDTGKLTVLTLL